MSASRVMWGQIVVVFSIVLVAVWGATQWARGMHFPSHDLVSAAIAWAVAVCAYTAAYRRRLRNA